MHNIIRTDPQVIAAFDDLEIVVAMYHPLEGTPIRIEHSQHVVGM